MQLKSNERKCEMATALAIESDNTIRMMPILDWMDERDGGIIALDGRAASGKTYLSALLRSYRGAGLVHMDDFFLPPELRTEERLNTPGGNVHYERFISEVLEVLPLTRNKPFSYRKFSCRTMSYDGVREVSSSPWIVVEGAYSHHPLFENYMDLRVFSDITPEVQKARITARNGEEKAAEFASKWIPLEEKYISEFKIQEKADLIVPNLCPTIELSLGSVYPAQPRSPAEEIDGISHALAEAGSWRHVRFAEPAS